MADRDALRQQEEAFQARIEDNQRRAPLVADAAGVSVAEVKQASRGEVRLKLTTRNVDPRVIKAATSGSGLLWLAGERYWLDDPEFGEIVDIETLAYDAELGLHPRAEQ